MSALYKGLYSWISVVENKFKCCFHAMFLKEHISNELTEFGMDEFRLLLYFVRCLIQKRGANCGITYILQLKI